MSLEKKKAMEFNWTPAFEAGLIRLLLSYRTAERGGSCAESRLAFERRHARDFARSLETLMRQHGPELAVDSDLAGAVARLQSAHDGAVVREVAKHGEVRG